MVERIRMARKARNMLQKQLAKELGLTRTHYNQIEGGNVALSERNIKDICRILGINEEWLRTGEGEMDCIPQDEIGFIMDEMAVEKDTEFGKLIASAMHTYHTAPQEVKDNLDEWLRKTIDDYNKKV